MLAIITYMNSSAI